MDGLYIFICQWLGSDYLCKINYFVSVQYPIKNCIVVGFKVQINLGHYIVMFLVSLFQHMSLNWFVHWFVNLSFIITIAVLEHVI